MAVAIWDGQRQVWIRVGDRKRRPLRRVTGWRPLGARKRFRKRWPPAPQTASFSSLAARNATSCWRQSAPPHRWQDYAPCAPGGPHLDDAKPLMCTRSPFFRMLVTLADKIRQQALSLLLREIMPLRELLEDGFQRSRFRRSASGRPCERRPWRSLLLPRSSTGFPGFLAAVWERRQPSLLSMPSVTAPGVRLKAIQRLPPRKQVPPRRIISVAAADRR